MPTEDLDALVIGGGAAGVFAAIIAAEKGAKVLLLEQSQKLLSKVKISGGGRCNVTHSCFDPKALVKNYPRGNKELLGPFNRFQPEDMIAWLESRDVQVKTERDGRMFPATDDSQTIIDCLLRAAKEAGVHIQRRAKVVEIKKGFEIFLGSGETLQAKALMLATGSQPKGHEMAKSLGHTIINPVPSLFTFNIPDSPLLSLAGVAVQDVKVSLPKFKLDQRGPLLITHWGFSGPAVIKLSAWGARELHKADYHTDVLIDWIPDLHPDQLIEKISGLRKSKSKKGLINSPLCPLPKQLWKKFLSLCEITETLPWNQLSNLSQEKLITKLKRDRYTISGKTTYKEEFVTCGGVKLSEVNFKTMESKVCPGLYFGGEILDLDGITGGFNFQAAWTTGWIAGNSISEALDSP